MQAPGGKQSGQVRILGCVDGDGWGGHGKRVSGKGFKRTDVGRAQPTGGSRIFIIGGRTFNLGCAPPPRLTIPRPRPSLVRLLQRRRRAGAANGSGALWAQSGFPNVAREREVRGLWAAKQSGGGARSCGPCNPRRSKSRGGHLEAAAAKQAALQSLLPEGDARKRGITYLTSPPLQASRVKRPRRVQSSLWGLEGSSRTSAGPAS